MDDKDLPMLHRFPQGVLGLWEGAQEPAVEPTYQARA
jgi:hypothetical protein